MERRGNKPMKPLLLIELLQKAVRTGMKTQTRRIEKGLEPFNNNPDTIKSNPERLAEVKSNYQVGDILYLKEGFKVPKELDKVKPSQIAGSPVEYKLGGTSNWIGDNIDDPGRWRSPLHMPMRFARTFVKVTEVKTHRIQDIERYDCVQEGMQRHVDGVRWLDSMTGEPTYNEVKAFRSLWAATCGIDSWNANPWVVAYTFTLCTKDGKEINI